MTFEQLDLLLRQVSEGMDGTSDWPPPQEKECMVVATLNLLRLQVIYQPQTLCVLLFRVY